MLRQRRKLKILPGVFDVMGEFFIVLELCDIVNNSTGQKRIFSLNSSMCIGFIGNSMLKECLCLLSDTVVWNLLSSWNYAVLIILVRGDWSYILFLTLMNEITVLQEEVSDKTKSLYCVTSARSV